MAFGHGERFVTVVPIFGPFGTNRTVHELWKWFKIKEATDVGA
jgi:hypothetical protein